MGKSVLVGLSGGVDSAVSTLLLKRQGYDVTGAFYRMHSFAESEIRAAQSAADALSIPLLVLDMRKDFENLVIRGFVDEYLAGRTPNPCIICNPLVKFAALCETADKYKIANIATGHYAGAGRTGQRYHIIKSSVKDQSYMLSRLPQSVIARLLLPLFNAKKTEIKAIAAQAGLPAALKKDSQDICFLGGGGYADFLAGAGVQAREGDFIDADTGMVAGRHRGLFFYTVGQRKNLGLSLGRPVFVKSIDAKNNIVYLSQRPPVSKAAGIADVVWQSRVYEPGESFFAAVKTRFGARDERAEIFVLDKGRARIEFEAPAPAVTPGQTAALYDGDAVVGAGFIEYAQ